MCEQNQFVKCSSEHLATTSISSSLLRLGEKICWCGARFTFRANHSTWCHLAAENFSRFNQIGRWKCLYSKGSKHNFWNLKHQHSIKHYITSDAFYTFNHVKFFIFPFWVFTVWLQFWIFFIVKTYM